MSNSLIKRLFLWEIIDSNTELQPLALGWRAFLAANVKQSNTDLPATMQSLPTIVEKFNAKGLGAEDVVTLSRSVDKGTQRFD